MVIGKHSAGRRRKHLELQLENKQSRRNLTNFRVWKSGKTWLYAASLLTVIAGGTIVKVSSEILNSHAQTLLNDPFDSQANADTQALSEAYASASPSPFSVNSSAAEQQSSAAVFFGNASSAAPLASFSAAAPAAASLGVGTIENGTQWDTGNHGALPNFANNANWGIGGGASKGSAVNQLGLITQGGLVAGAAAYLPAVDMTKPLTVSGSFQATTTSGSDWTQAGDGIGFILSPVASANLREAGGQETLGIGGLPNTIFLGRDLYSNPGTDGGSGGGSTETAIRFTNSAGVLQPASYDAGERPTASSGAVWAKMEDALNGTRQKSIDEAVQITWTPTGPGTDAGTTTGTLTMTLNSTAGNTPATVTLTTTFTVQNVMTIGLAASQGGNTGTMGATLNSATGMQATQNVLVNYVNQHNGSSAANWKQSTVTANVADSVAVTDPGGQASSNPGGPGNPAVYTYVAPDAPAGYTFVRVDPQAVNVQNFFADTANPNVINVYYTPNQQTAKFFYSYAAGTTGPALPATVQGNGFTDDAIAAPTLDIPSGYTASFLAPNGTTYPTLAEAIASQSGPGGTAGTYGPNTSSATGSDYTANTNDFKVILTANPVVITVSGQDSSDADILAKQPDGQKGGSITAQTGAAVTPNVPQNAKDANGFSVTAVVTDQRGNDVTGDFFDSKLIASEQNTAYTVHYKLSEQGLSESTSASMSNSESLVVSASMSNSQSASVSESTAASESLSTSASLSSSDSTAASESTANSVSLSTSESLVNSASSSERASASTSDSIVTSESLLNSESQMDSASASTSTSSYISESLSASNSASASDSTAASQSLVDSDSVSTSDSQVTRESQSNSDSASTSDSLVTSQSQSVSDSISASDSVADSQSLVNSQSALSESESMHNSLVSESTSLSHSASDSGSNSLSQSESASSSDSTVNSQSVSTSTSQSQSQSDSTANSQSASTSASQSQSQSDSTANSQSVSESTSQSQSQSNSTANSQSASTSASQSQSQSDSTVNSQSGSESTSQSQSQSESTANSQSLSTSASQSQSQSESTANSQSASESTSLSESHASDSSSHSGTDSSSASDSSSQSGTDFTSSSNRDSGLVSLSDSQITSNSYTGSSSGRTSEVSQSPQQKTALPKTGDTSAEVVRLTGETALTAGLAAFLLKKKWTRKKKDSADE